MSRIQIHLFPPLPHASTRPLQDKEGHTAADYGYKPEGKGDKEQLGDGSEGSKAPGKGGEL